MNCILGVVSRGKEGLPLATAMNWGCFDEFCRIGKGPD